MENKNGQPERPRVRSQSLKLLSILEISGAFEKQLAKKLNVNGTDLETMEHLIKSGPLSPTEIARRLDITTAAVTSSVDRLTDLGHVERTPNPTDRRGVIVTAKPDSAAQAMSFLLPMIYSVDSVLDRFSEEEQELVGRYLEQVSAAYAEHLDDGSPAPVDA